MKSDMDMLIYIMVFNWFYGYAEQVCLRVKKDIIMKDRTNIVHNGE